MPSLSQDFDGRLGKKIIELLVWAVGEGLRGVDASQLFDGLCQRLVGTGVPLWRAFAGMTSGLMAQRKHISNSDHRGGNALASPPNVPGKTKVTGMLENLSGETRLFPIIGDPIIFVKIPHA
jgi:hypothetical protein